MQVSRSSFWRVLHEHKLKRRLRWVASAFSFFNLGRGYFAATKLYDCNDSKACWTWMPWRRCQADSYDGIIVTNIFGLWTDFQPYIKFARQTGKVLLIDNAAGVNPRIPDHDYQVFSLHQTKPFGAGEGGLAILPAGESELAAELLNYKALRAEPATWLNSTGRSPRYQLCLPAGSSCRRYPEWSALRYQYQATRVIQIAEAAGLSKLFPYANNSIATCLPFLAPRPGVELSRLENHRFILGKFYKPLAAMEMAQVLYSRIVNIPSHPDVSKLGRDEFESILSGLTAAPGK